jgi:hypothetical protein
MKKININNKDYNMSSPTNEEYKKQYIESFGDVYVEDKNNDIIIKTIT